MPTIALYLKGWARSFSKPFLLLRKLNILLLKIIKFPNIGAFSHSAVSKYWGNFCYLVMSPFVLISPGRSHLFSVTLFLFLIFVFPLLLYFILDEDWSQTYVGRKKRKYKQFLRSFLTQVDFYRINQLKNLESNLIQLL